MTTQPRFPDPGTRAPDRSRRRVADRPVALRPSSWRPRPGPGGNQHLRHDAAPRQPVPPTPACPTQPLQNAPTTAPFQPKSDAPRPQEFFGKNSYVRTNRSPIDSQTPPRHSAATPR